MISSTLVLRLSQGVVSKRGYPALLGELCSRAGAPYVQVGESGCGEVVRK